VVDGVGITEVISMATHRSSWKRRERQSAKPFGARRQPLSGGSGRDDRTRSDSDHDRLYIESKLRASWGVRTLFDQTRKLAQKEDKIPVLALASKGKPGCLYVVASADLSALVAAYAEADRSGPGSNHGRGAASPRLGMEHQRNRPQGLLNGE
jgi:hypothetical protein